MHFVLRFAGVIVLAVVTGVVLFHAYSNVAASEKTFTVAFSRGAAVSADAQATLDGVAGLLKRNDRLYAEIVGHTGTRGDTAANQALSVKRAEVVKSALTDRGVETARMEASGVGGIEPLPRGRDETDRTYQKRLSRVEINVKRLR